MSQSRIGLKVGVLRAQEESGVLFDGVAGVAIGGDAGLAAALPAADLAAAAAASLALGAKVILTPPCIFH